MSEIPNPFQEMSKVDSPKKRGRPATRPQVGEAKASKTEVGKTNRKPVGLRGPSNTPTRKGYKRRWVNDTEDRIQMFMDGGYVPVKDDSGDNRTRRAGRGVDSVLMEIEEDIYNQDQKTKYDKWNADSQERLKPREGAGYYQPKTKM